MHNEAQTNEKVCLRCECVKTPYGLQQKSQEH